MKPKLRRVPTGARSPAVEELALAHALEECLEAMAQGETDLDRLAGRYPDAADEIRSLLSIAKELKDKGAPGSVLALEFKETLRDRLRQRLNA